MYFWELIAFILGDGFALNMYMSHVFLEFIQVLLLPWIVMYYPVYVLPCRRVSTYVCSLSRHRRMALES